MLRDLFNTLMDLVCQRPTVLMMLLEHCGTWFETLSATNLRRAM